MEIGKIKLNGRAALAPMAGVADRAMRELCMLYGAAFCVTELISAKAVSMGDRKSLELMDITDSQRPVGLQLFGSDADVMAEAARLAEARQPDFIDINMGCPAPKVLSSGGGSALMKNPRLAESIVSAVVKSVRLPVSVKMRTGFYNGEFTAAELAKRCESAGAAFITVHGRTREQMYAPPADLDAIAAVKASVSIPVIGNGDIYTKADADNMYNRTGCDFVMVGRGALGAPWIFSEINAGVNEGHCAADECGKEHIPAKDNCNIPGLSAKSAEISDTALSHAAQLLSSGRLRSFRLSPPRDMDIGYRMRVLLIHAALISKYKGERTAMLEIRKHAAWYIKGIKGAANFRRECGEISTLGELKALCERVCRMSAV